MTLILAILGKFISFTRLLQIFSSAAGDENVAGLMKNVEFCSLEEGVLGLFSLVYFLTVSKY